MKLAKTVTFIVLGSAPLFLAAQNAPLPMKSPAAYGRIVRVDGDINAPVPEVWHVFTTSEGAEEFFAQKANIGTCDRRTL